MNQTLHNLLNIETEKPAPPVTKETLTKVHEILSEELSMPLRATYSEPENENSDAEYSVTINQLLPINKHPVFGPYLGILSEAKIEDHQEDTIIPLSRITDVEDDGSHELINFYSEWFWQYR